MARDLLAQAAADGVAVKGVTFEIPTYYTSQLAKDVLTVMQANLADVGVNVQPTFLDVPTWRTVVDDSDNWNIAYVALAARRLSYNPIWYLADNQWGLDDLAYADLFAAMERRKHRKRKPRRVPHCALIRTKRLTLPICGCPPVTASPRHTWQTSTTSRPPAAVRMWIIRNGGL